MGSGGEIRELSPGGPVHVRLSPGHSDRRAPGQRLREAPVPKFQGAIFDIDGVLVDSPRREAWRESLRQLMESDWSDIRNRTSWSPEAFTSGVYDEQMSGKPRMSGARTALAYFRVPDDDGRRLAEYADRKQAMVVQLIHRRLHRVPRRAALHHRRQRRRDEGGGSPPPPRRWAIPAPDKARQLRAEHAMSASLRPGLVLEFFDADVSGRDFAQTTSRDIPHRRTRARDPAEDSIVIKDAAAGVQAAKAGDMAAIGIAPRQ